MIAAALVIASEMCVCWSSEFHIDTVRFLNARRPYDSPDHQECGRASILNTYVQ
jgi:hypothetical protein